MDNIRNNSTTIASCILFVFFLKLSRYNTKHFIDQLSNNFTRPSYKLVKFNPMSGCSRDRLGKL